MESRLLALGIKPIKGERFVVMSEGELAALEHTLGVRLDESYRHFLQTYGAASFQEIIKFHPAHPLPAYLSSSGDGHFDYFYGPATETDDTTYSLARVVRVMAHRVPESLMPIGGDCIDNQICLGIRGAEAGKVYYWDHEREPDEEDYLAEGLPVPPDLAFQNVHLIADSFEDFIARLYIAEE